MGFRTILNTFIALLGMVSISLTAVAGPSSYKSETYTRPAASRNLSFDVLFNMYQAKCVHVQNPQHPCFLTEQEVDPQGGRPGYVLLFRGESSLNSLPATSSFYRWSLSSPAICKGACTDSERLTYLFDVSRKLRPLVFPESLFFREQDRSWRDEIGKLVKGTLAPGDTGLEVLAMTHKIGSGLYFESQKNKIFDPMVSFSLDPLVADLFARRKEKSEGVLWIASVPQSAIKFMKGSECKTLTPQVGTLYDFTGCIDSAWNELEIEINAVMYLPSIYHYDRILNR